MMKKEFNSTWYYYDKLFVFWYNKSSDNEITVDELDIKIDYYAQQSAQILKKECIKLKIRTKT